MHSKAGMPAERDTIFAQNYFDPQFAGWTAFHAITEPVIGYTGSRRDFLGRNGAADAPRSGHRHRGVQP